MPADLVTNLWLESQGFDKNINASMKQVDKFKKKSSGLYSQIAAVSGKIDALGGGVTRFAGNLAKMAVGATAAMGVSTALSDVVQKSMDFEKSMSSLKALTGVSAEEMEYFQRQAIKLGSTSTQTASQVVEAFQLIGSQQPELLKNKEALAEVTKQAIILAEASGMDVPEAARALSGSINQMGESADKAGEYINILAAASQAGSADIPYLTKAIERSGGAASSVGVRYNELVAAIEAIAPKVTEASEAGTYLRNIFLTLEASSDQKLKPSVVGLTAALENLAAKNLNATQMTKMFGKENVTAALAIVNAKDEYKKYVDAITGTNTALEQQKINNDNLAGAVNNVSSAWAGLILTLNKSNGALKDSANMTARLINQFTELMKTAEQKQQEILSDSVNNEKKGLDRAIKSYEDFGYSRAEAISKVMELQERNNAGGVGYAAQLREAQKELDALEAKLKKVKEDNLMADPKKAILSGLPVVGPAIAASGTYSSVNINPNNWGEINRIEKQIEKQKELVRTLQSKNTIYQESDKYLNEELKKVSEIAEKNIEAKENVEAAAKKKAEDSPMLGSIEMLNKLLEEWRDKFNKAATDEARSAANKMIQELQSRIIKIKVQYEVEYKYGKREDSKSVDAGKNPGLSVPVVAPDFTTLNKQLQQYKESLSQNSIKVADDKQLNTLNSMANLLGSINTLTGKGAAGWLSWSVSIMQAIAQVIPQLNALTTAQTKTAVSGAAASVAATPIVGWIMAGAAVASVIAAIMSAPKFATGGIVPGMSYAGDKVPVMANSGEMILSRVQQGRLFDILNNGGGGRSSDVRVTGELVARGDNLVAVIRNSEKLNSKMR